MNQRDFQNEIIRKTTGEIRTFLSQLAYETSGYKSLHNLTEQVEHQYHGRFLIELIQNAHDAMNEHNEPGDHGRLDILVDRDETPYGALYVANDGSPFTRSNFEHLSQLGQSDKDPEKSIGNKGIGFRSVLEISNAPEIYSRSTKNSVQFDGYCFYFSPSVTKMFEKPILDLIKGDDKPCSPIDSTVPLIEWGREQLTNFRNLYCSRDDHWLTKELKYLSPYLLPIPIQPSNKTKAIKAFEDKGFASVIRLPFKSDAACALAMKMTEALDENTILFLDRVKFLSLNSGIKLRLIERKPQALNDPNNGHEIKLEVVEDGEEGYTKKKYWLWSITLGEENNLEEREEIKKAILEDELPGRWPELSKATVSIAIRIDKEAEEGRINIYLPTQLPTGCAAHFNGPFYGDMSRTAIDFEKRFNKLLLRRIGSKAIEIILESLAGKGVDDARAILDILSPSPYETHAGSEWFNIVKEACKEKKINLSEQPIMLTDEGWKAIGYAKLIPGIHSPNVLTPDKIRDCAAFDVVHKDLMSRQREITSLFEAIGIRLFPLDEDLAATVENIAGEQLKAGEDANWNGFWHDLIKLFKNNAEPLKEKKILLGSDGELHSCDQSCTIFFPPRQGLDDDEIQIEGDSGDIPQTLRAHIAFLNEKIEIYNPKDARQQTVIRKFVELSLVQRYRVMEIIKSVLIPKIPSLPVPLRGDQSRICQDILLWALKLVAGMPDRGKGRSGTLQLLRQIPVPCYGGWYPIELSLFGPSWQRTAGTDVFDYLNGANTRECQEHLKKMLLPPIDKLWDGKGEMYQDLLESAGVIDGLRLVSIEPKDWDAGTMAYKSSYQLPDISPPCMPDDLWKKYTEVYSPKVRDQMYYSGYFSYEVQSLSMVPGLERYAIFDEKTRIALMNSLFAGMHRWKESWLTSDIKKVDGLEQHIKVESPLAYCLKSLPWIEIESDGNKEWAIPSQRWYIPKKHLLVGRSWRYGHLRPLPGILADKIDRCPQLYDQALAHLGMPKFDPDADERSGNTRLLDDLASALASDIPDPNMFLNHIRLAWSNYATVDSDTFPKYIIISNAQKQLEAVKPDAGLPIYLPDSSSSFASELNLFSLSVIEIETMDAKRLAPDFKRSYGDAVRLASELDVWPIVEGKRWEKEPGTQFVEDKFAWLPSVLLTLYAFVGSSPPGLYAKKMSGSVQIMRDAKICWVDSLNAGLWMGDESIATPAVTAMWLSQEKVLVCDIAFKDQMSKYAEALKTIIDRDDLELPLRHVLEKLEYFDAPTHDNICTALESLKIKPAQYDQALDLWQGDIGQMIRMTMPVVALLNPAMEIGAIADIKNEENLEIYLQKLEISNLTPQKILSLIRSADDYYTLGNNLYEILGETAQLDRWNVALVRVGERQVSNSNAEEEFRNQLRSAKGLLLATLAHIIRRHSAGLPFEEITEQLERIPFPAVLAFQLWDVEFEHALQNIVPFFETLNALPDELSALKDSDTLEDLKSNLLSAGVEANINPILIHKKNHENFKNVLFEFMKIAVAFCLRENISPLSWEKSPEESLSNFAEFFKHKAYLHLCNNEEYYELIQYLPREETHINFWNHVDHSTNLQTLAASLSLSPEQIEGADIELEKYKELKRKQNRLTPVCEKEFDYTDENLSQLWNHIIGQIQEESLPEINLKSISSLDSIAKRKKRQHEETKKTSKPKGRTNKEMEHLIGFAGEIHSYRMLNKTYGNEVVHPGTWKSSYSKRVFPGNSSDDEIGCDFIINQKKINYYIEVKASMEENDSFELGSSEIRKAMDLVKKKKHIFVIMHVQNALSKNPKFRLLPNPYDPKCHGVYSIEDAGARIRYRLKS